MKHRQGGRNMIPTVRARGLFCYFEGRPGLCQNLYHCWWRGAPYCMEEYEGMI
jgi:hypothetical protein